MAAVATVTNGRPAVRFMALVGLDDLSLIGGTMISSRKVKHIRKNPEVALSIWSGKSYTDPYVLIQSKAKIHEDRRQRRSSGTPSWRLTSGTLRTLAM